LVTVALLSCNDTVSINSRRLEEIEKDADSLAGKIERKVEQGWDSTKAKAKDLKEKIGNRRDSLKKEQKDTLN
jgi:hypothetical protein